MTMKIAYVKSETSRIISLENISWEAVNDLLSRPCIDHLKTGSGWLPADISVGARTTERVRSVSCLVLDVEAKAERINGVKTVIGTEPPTMDDIEFELSTIHGLKTIGHTSYSHHDPAIMPADVPHARYRLVFALSRPLSKDEVRPLALHVAEMLGLADCVDTACMEAARLYYLPRCPAERKEHFRHFHTKGEPLKVDKLLAQIKSEEELIGKLIPPPRNQSKGGVIDAFNATYSINEMLTKHGYIPKGSKRWLHPSSTTGEPGARLLPDSNPECVYSSHGNDPLNDGHKHDAFDCYRILEHGGDFTSSVREAARMLGLDNRSNATGSPLSDFNHVGDTFISPDPKFERVSLCDVLSNPPSPQSYVWGECIPSRALTLLAAHGGTGKSLLAMQLAAHVATGRKFLGLDTQQTKTLFFSAEDATDTIRRRFAALCKADTLDPQEVAENLTILDATASPCLFHEVAAFGVRTAEPTTHYAELKAMIEAEGIGFLIVDNASDSFGANPIDRQAVTKFIRALVHLVSDAGGAVLLLSHVNKNTSRNAGKQTDTEGYADSAAWHNAARSRLFLNAVDDKANTLTLAHNKNNYGKKQAPLTLAFREDGSGLTVTDTVLNDFDAGDTAATLAHRNANRLPVLKLIREFYKREEWISPAKESSTSNVYAMLRDEIDYPYLLNKRDCLALVRDCERDGLLTKETYVKPSRHTGKRWGLTVKGLEFIGATLEPAPSKQAELEADKLDELLPC